MALFAEPILNATVAKNISAAEPYEAGVIQSLEKHADELARVSSEIWKNPELGYREHLAVKLLTECLEQNGYSVKRNYCQLETSFLGEYQTANFDPEQHPTIAVLCEYDALPEIGHACGHNLIAEAGLATFLAVADALKSSNGRLNGKIVCMGTPAEEMGGGKIVLLESGAFDDVSFAMMAHPAPIDMLEPDILGIDHLKAEYYGKAAHASCGPWEGINALDAVIAAYNNISMLRQQTQPGHQVHMIIKQGGAKPNIIPEYAKAQVYIRAPTVSDVASLRKRVITCLQAGADATGCRVEIGLDDVSYSGLMSNRAMLSVYRKYGEKHGMFFPTIRPGNYGSTDMGNVSTAIPCIHPIFGCGDITFATMIHTKEFCVLSGKPESHRFARRTALALAMTSLELFASEDFRSRVLAEFRGSRKSFMGAVCHENDTVDAGFSLLSLPGFNPGRRRSSRSFLIEQGILPASSCLAENVVEEEP